jgi:hypothetical protein
MKEVYPDANYFIFTDVIRQFPGWVCLDVERYREKLIKNFGVCPEILQNYFGLSDALRFVFLSENPHTLYMDTDIYCQKVLPEIPSGRVGILPHNICMMYNNDNTKYFTNLFKKYHEKYERFFVGISQFFDLDEQVMDLSEYFIHKSVGHGYSFEDDVINRREK